MLCVQGDLVKLREQLRTLEGRQAHVGAVAASELESALAAVSRAGRGAVLHLVVAADAVRVWCSVIAVSCQLGLHEGCCEFHMQAQYGLLTGSCLHTGSCWLPAAVLQRCIFTPCTAVGV